MDAQAQQGKQSISAQNQVIPAKRKIGEVSVDSAVPVNTPQPTSSTNYVKDKIHWQADGNIRIQIGNTRFKLHRSRLASESVWFRNLLDQRAGKATKSYEHQVEIDEVLGGVQKVGSADIFYLDVLSVEHPTAEQFGALLTAMQRGIDYVYNPPRYEVIVDILKAASFFQVQRYLNFAEKYFQNMFPDNWSSIRVHTSPAVSLKTLLLGLAYGGRLNSILRHCYYDVARTHPLSYYDGGISDNGLHQIYASSLQNLESKLFLRFMIIQRHLVQAWDRIKLLLDFKCTVPSCGVKHELEDLPVGYSKARSDYPFDPIMGIRTMLSCLANPCVEFGYCLTAKKEVQRRLQQELDSIWADMKKWASIP